MKKIMPPLVSVLIIGGLIYWFNQPPMPSASTGKSLVAVTVPNLSDSEVAGETLFNKNCASCHGTNASGLEGAGPPLVHIIYEPNHHGDTSFQLAAKNGVRAHHWKFGNMPPVADITDVDVAKIITYVRALQRANGIN